MYKIVKWTAVLACGLASAVYVAGIGLLMYGVSPSGTCSTPVHAYEAVWPLWAVENITHISNTSLIGRVRLAVIDWSLDKCNKDSK